MAAMPLAIFYKPVDAVVASEFSNARIQRRLRFNLIFTNPLNVSLKEQRFWCYLPASVTPAQHLRDIQVSTLYQVENDVLGHHILKLSFESFPALAQKIVMVTADIELIPDAAPQVLHNTDKWLAAERFIESNDSRIQALAYELQRSTIKETAFAIYTWVKTQLNYAGYLAEELGALHALLYKRGDCTEYASLVVALARASKIPARMIGGYVTNHDLILKVYDYHNWAELYFDGAWQVVDAQKEHWLPSIDQYITFRVYRDVSFNSVGLAHRYRVQGDLQVAF